MGKSTPKQQVTAYYMSLHFGICHGPAELVRVRMGEKDLWQGNLSDPTVIGIDLPELYGGIKAEGGADGAIHFYPGKIDQKMTTFMSFKYGRTSSTMTGYRGIATFAMTERIRDIDDLNGIAIEGPVISDPVRPGFYYSANSPYLRTIDAKVKRIPDASGDWQNTIAAIPHVRYGKVSPMAVFFCVGQGWGTDTEMFDGAYRPAMAAVIDQIIDYKTRNPDARFDFGVCFSHSIFYQSSVPINIAYHDASIDDLEAAKEWVLTVPRSGGESMWKNTYRYMYDFFDAGLPGSGDEDVFVRRVAIMLYGNGTTESRINSDLLADGGKGEDVVTQDGGIFNTDDKTEVDTYSVISPYTSSPPDMDGADRFANQDLFPRTFTHQDVIDQTLECVRPSSKEPDMNPAHIIYECLTNASWGMGAPTTQLNLTSFIAAAETLYEEEFGLSMAWFQQSSIENFIREVLDHIQATLYVDPKTGLFNIKLIRNDYDAGSLPILDKNNAKVTSFQRKLVSETINEIVVSWTNPDNEQTETITAQDNANIAIQGGIVSDSRNYYGVRTADLATFLAWRDLASASAPLVACEIEADRSSWDFVPGGVIKLSWPEYGVDSIILRIGNIDYGKPGDPRIKLSCTEDIFGLDMVAYTVTPPPSWNPPATEPEPATATEIFTLNYPLAVNMLDPDLYADGAYPDGFLAVMAATEAVDGYEFDLYTDLGAGYQLDGTKSILSRGTLAEAIDAEVTTIIDVSLLNRSRGAGPSAGGFVVFGEGDEANHEIGYVTNVSGNDFTVKRGALDTTPKAWPAGTPIWFISATSEIADNTIRGDGETAALKVLTRTNGGLLALADAPPLSAVVNDRPWRPTRPANVTVAGQGFGEVELGLTDPVTVSWANRNRLTEDSVFLAWDAADVTPEAGQTTTITLMLDDDTVVATYSGLTGTTHDIAAATFLDSRTRVKVESERDGYVSWQGHEIVVIADFGYYGYAYGFNYGGAAPLPPGPPSLVGSFAPDNPDAESGITGWSALTGSTFDAVSSLDAVEVPGSVPYAGTYSFYHGLTIRSVVTTSIDVADLDSGIQTAIATGKATAVLKYALLTDKDGYDRGSADLFFYNSSGDWIGGAMFDLRTSNNVWTVIENGPIEIPATTSEIRIQLRGIRNGDDNKVNVYVDDISVDIYDYDGAVAHYLVWSALGDDPGVFILDDPPDEVEDPFSYIAATSDQQGAGWGIDYGFRWKEGSPDQRQAITDFINFSGISTSDIDDGLTSLILRWRQLNANSLGSATEGRVTVEFYDGSDFLTGFEQTDWAMLTRNGAGNQVLDVIIPAESRKFKVKIEGDRTVGTSLVSVHAYFMYMNAYCKKNS